MSRYRYKGGIVMQVVDLARYIIQTYPYPSDLSKARLNKIIYLVDWKNTLVYGNQMTDIQWKFNHYGPYVDRIELELRQDGRFAILNTTNLYGHKKEVVTLLDNINNVNFIEPNENEKTIIDFIIEKTRRLNFSEFINLVYSTYPIISQEKGSDLDLAKLAVEYKQILNNQPKN